MNEVPGICRHVAVDPETQELRIARGPVPTPSPGEMLIEVSCAGINRADLLQRKGLYPPPEDASPILGLEVAGTVAAIGKDSGSWAVGDTVCALTHGGGYAEYALAPAGQCMPIPGDLGMAEAAALPEALLTVWHNLFQRAGLKSGEKVLIHGGASGIGTLGIAICHTLGAEVYSTAGTTEKCATLKRLGAARAINYREQDFEQVLTELGLAGQIDVILDMVGGPYIQKNLNVAAPEARIVNIAYLQGFKAEVNFAPLLMKRITMTGSTLRAQTATQKTVMVQEIMQHVFPHIESGQIKPVVDSVYPLAAAADAHARMQSGAHTGKIILQMTGD